MNPVKNLVREIRAVRPFLPAKDFKTSLRFYETIGFEAFPLGDTMAEMSLGPHAFILQGHHTKEWAENMMMHVLVDDVDAWWRLLQSLDLPQRFDVPAPCAPRAEPWGLSVTYVTDPSGVLWHFAEETKSG